MVAVAVHLLVDFAEFPFHQVRIRQVPASFLEAGFELRPVFDDEAVNGSVDDGQFVEDLQVAVHIFQALAGQAVHEVDREIAEARIVCSEDRFLPLPCRMDTAEARQEVVGKGLDADTEAVDAKLPKRGSVRLIEALRIGFERDFRILCEDEGLSDTGHDAFQFRRRQERRRAAAEIERVRCLSGIGTGLDFPAEGRHIACLIAL